MYAHTKCVSAVWTVCIWGREQLSELWRLTTKYATFETGNIPPASKQPFGANNGSNKNTHGKTNKLTNFSGHRHVCTKKEAFKSRPVLQNQTRHFWHVSPQRLNAIGLVRRPEHWWVIHSGDEVSTWATRRAKMRENPPKKSRQLQPDGILPQFWCVRSKMREECSLIGN